LKKIFWSVSTRGLWAIVERCPFPEDVQKLEVSEIQEMIAKSSRRRKTAAQKARALYQAAQESIGLKQISSADRYRVKMSLEEVKRTEGLLKEIEKEIKGLLKQIEYAVYLLSIPYQAQELFRLQSFWENWEILHIFSMPGRSSNTRGMIRKRGIQDKGRAGKSSPRRAAGF